MTFRGVRIENTPVWLQNVMGKSGLFTDYLVKMAQVITWWYLGENGTFTYWPDGPLGEPSAARAPAVEQGRRRAERDDVPPRRPGRAARTSATSTGLKNRSLLGYDAGADDWVSHHRRGGDPPLPTEQMRLLVHWSAEVYADAEELEMNLDRSRDLTFDVVFERLLADLHARGVNVTEPSDPLHDSDFIRALTSNYSIVPTKDWAKEAA